MKAIYKTVPPKMELKIDESFRGEKNTKIMRKLVPELLRLLAPRYKPTQRKLQQWLSALHRHKRGRYLKRKSGKLEADNRRIHTNSRLNEVC
jgi:CRISPR/Cas system-associated protein Cas10 (large subunit of type III CRISPR-Cas system)